MHSLQKKTDKIFSVDISAKDEKELSIDLCK
jgi:hypothetical protein